jgi:hypothetical protein
MPFSGALEVLVILAGNFTYCPAVPESLLVLVSTRSWFPEPGAVCARAGLPTTNGASARTSRRSTIERLMLLTSSEGDPSGGDGDERPGDEGEGRECREVGELYQQALLVHYYAV